MIKSRGSNDGLIYLTFIYVTQLQQLIPGLAKLPQKFNQFSDKLGLTSLVEIDHSQETTAGQSELLIGGLKYVSAIHHFPVAKLRYHMKTVV